MRIIVESRRARAWRAAALSLCVGLVGACAQEGDRAIEEVRVAHFVGDVRSWGLSPERRFGLRRAEQIEAEQGGSSSPGLRWQTPAGWAERAPSGMRALDFVVDAEAECTLTLLGGGGGGLGANIQRWRKQLGLAEMTSAELEALPAVAFFGGEGTLVEFQGTWRGMSGAEEQPDWGLLGVLSTDGAEARFLKLIGPQDVVSREREAFLGLAASLRRASSAGSGVESGEGSMHAANDVGAHGGQIESDPGAEAPSPGLQRSAGLAWDVPATWRQGPTKPFRVVTLLTSSNVECYVTLLGGDGGGAQSNVARWARQLEAGGQAAEIVEERPLSMLGAEGLFVAIRGALSGADETGGEGPRPATLFAAMRSLGDRSVFVKLVGESKDVEAERERFLSFVSGLRFDTTDAGPSGGSQDAGHGREEGVR